MGGLLLPAPRGVPLGRASVSRGAICTSRRGALEIEAAKGAASTRASCRL
jgi:hypothetical protein